MPTSDPVLAINLDADQVVCVFGKALGASAQRVVIPGEHGDFASQRAAFEIGGVGSAALPCQTRDWPDPVLLSEAIEQATEQACRGEPCDRVFVSLSHPEFGHVRVTTQIDVADEPAAVRTREVERLKTQAISQVLGIDRDVLLLEALGFDGNGFSGISDPLGLPVTRLRGTFHLVTIPLAVRAAVAQVFETTGLEIERLVYRPQAFVAAYPSELVGAAMPAARTVGNGGGHAQDAVSSETVQTFAQHPDASTSVLLIDIGGTCTDLALIDQGRLAHSQSIRWGGVRLAEAVGTACGLTTRQACQTIQEGLSCTKPGVSDILREHLQRLNEPIQQLLGQDGRPGRVVVTGRWALLDGLVEWIEEQTKIPTVLGRSPWAKPLHDLSQQVAVSPALGLLGQVFGPTETRTPHPLRPTDRFIHRAKKLLLEYF